LSIVRIAFVPLTLLLLANCAGQPDPAKYALAKRDTAVRTSFDKRHLAKRDGGIFRATSDVPKIGIGKSGRDAVVTPSRVHTHEIRETRDAEKDGKGFGNQTIPASMTVDRSTSPYPAPKDGSFLEGVKDDKENQLLKLKTNICRGC